MILQQYFLILNSQQLKIKHFFEYQISTMSLSCLVIFSYSLIREFIVVKIQNQNRQMQDRYNIIERKSKNIFKALSKSSEKPVILKKVPFSSLSSKAKEYIVNEVNTLLRMDYIHILRYLDFEINKKDVTVDIAMQFCEGGTLQDFIAKTKSQNKRIEEDEVWRIFYQLAQALDYIHKDKIIHRNINPSNIYFRQAQRKNIKLGGFSLAKKVDFEQKFSATVLPNTYYLSPQQIQTGICTLETDIWALGCIMYQLCALQSPFRHTNQFERAKMIQQSQLKKINYYSLELNRVILWCLKKNPEDRPTLIDLLGAPEINMRIRERRYQEKLAELLSKEENLLRKERELAEKEDWLLSEQKTRVRYESLKKKSSEVLSNKTINFLRASNN